MSTLEFSKKMGLPQQRERITVDGLGTIKDTPKSSDYFTGKSSESLEKSGESGIIKLPDIQIYRSLGAKALNYNIKELATGEIFHFAEGTRIQNAQVFAGKGCKKKLKEETAIGLSEQIGGTPENWQHAKGNGVIDYYGEHRDAEVHWFQEETVGKHKFRVKRWLDED